MNQTEDTLLLAEEDEALLPKEPEENPDKEKETPEKKSKVKTYIKRTLLCIGTLLAFVLITVFSACYILLNGPSETMRDALVLSAKQASATKWLPGLFLSEKAIDQIEANSNVVITDVISLADLQAQNETISDKDEWADAIDGMRLVNITKPAFNGYLLIIKDPSRVFVGTASDFKGGKAGMNVFDITEKYQAIAAINGGEFPDVAGVGDGSMPEGITYSQGKLVYSGNTNRTFMGLTHDNKLVVSEGMTPAKAHDLGIRDGVCFQTGNSLISNDGENITLHYSDGNTGRAQRTAIGQRADGALLLLVTDGRTASSLGATHNELIDVMLEYGAICAGKLDGGSSSVMYYENWYELYGKDESALDEYQKRGLINSYKAFSSPRKMPTFFLVGEAAE